MRRSRRVYYDLFSHFYDRIIALHSGDASAKARDFLVERTGVQAGGRILDLCTGTGAVAICARRATGSGGLTVGLDFSSGMIRKARDKARSAGSEGVSFVVGDAGCLPFACGSFDAVSCSHAMYELSPADRERTLREAHRVLRPGGRFLMMEHCEPARPIARLLYRVRLSALGSAANRDFARDEMPFVRRFFAQVTRELSATGRSKLILGVKDGTPQAAG
jgi:demethylmenaquinone methyltransferase/2-methoxy-6-polyprenyl-1,4-benzoquinol methylase